MPPSTCWDYQRKSSALLRCWLAAAHGEALAANNQRDESLRAFDTASQLLPREASDPDGPYVVLDAVHLARWRGHALAQFGTPEAVQVLTNAPDALDPSFTRAETALRVDLAMAHAALQEQEAVQLHLTRAGQLAATIGSARQQRRIRAVYNYDASY